MGTVHMLPRFLTGAKARRLPVPEPFAELEDVFHVCAKQIRTLEPADQLLCVQFLQAKFEYDANRGMTNIPPDEQARRDAQYAEDITRG